MTVSIMNRLVRTLIETIEHPVFSSADIQNIEPNDNIRYALVKRAMRDGDLVQIKRGLYTINPLFRKNPLNRMSLSNRLYYPSYLSMEYALSYHGWIPEAVVVLTCATLKNSTVFNTPVGAFSYKRIPQSLFFSCVNVASSGGETALIASPLKALCDYVYVHKLQWVDRSPLIESLRIEEEDIETLTSEDFDNLGGNYTTAKNVEAFIAGLKKDLKL